MRNFAKKFIVILEVVSLLFGLSIPSYAATFGDVSWTIWYGSYVAYAADEGLFTGVSRGRFEPDRPITRGEFVKVLGRLHKKVTGKDAKPTKRELFKDITEKDFYADEAMWAVEKGIMQECEEDLFCPDQEVSRESMAVILNLYLESESITFTEPVDWLCTLNDGDEGILAVAYQDFEEISEWAFKAVDYLSQYRVVLGNTKSFFPQKKATRAEVAAMMTRVYQAVQYQEERMMLVEKILFDYIGDEGTQQFILDGEDFRIVTDFQEYHSIMERVEEFEPEYEMNTLELEEDYFDEKNLLIVENQAVGCPVFENRVTNVEMQGDTVNLTLFRDAHGSTADISGYLVLMEIPKEITKANIETVTCVHAIDMIVD